LILPHGYFLSSGSPVLLLSTAAARALRWDFFVHSPAILLRAPPLRHRISVRPY
jgi:hypothetical protein